MGWVSLKLKYIHYFYYNLFLLCLWLIIKTLHYSPVLSIKTTPKQLSNCEENWLMLKNIGIKNKKKQIYFQILYVININFCACTKSYFLMSYVFFSWESINFMIMPHVLNCSTTRMFIWVNICVEITT